jgi:uncharacterized damage-inducible protein DinB
MPKSSPPALSQSDSILRAFDIHNRITGYLIENLDPPCWRAPTPDGKGRDMAAIAAHIHSVHCMWLKAAGSAKVPPALDKSTVSPGEAMSALAETASLLRVLISNALEGDGRIKNFKPDATAFVGYLIAHDSHHRGQMAMLARQTGHPIPKSAGYGLWEWGVR